MNNKEAYTCGATGWDSEVDSIEDYFETEEAIEMISNDVSQRAYDWFEMDDAILDNLNGYGLSFNQDMLKSLLDVYGFKVTVTPFKYKDIK